MLGFSFQFDKRDVSLQTVSLVSSHEEISRVDELQGKIIFLRGREEHRFRFVRRLFGRKLEVSGPILVLTRELLDALLGFLHGQSAEVSLFGDGCTLRLQLAGRRVRWTLALAESAQPLALQTEEPSAPRSRWRRNGAASASPRTANRPRGNSSASLAELTEACLKGVAGLMIGMRQVNDHIDDVAPYQGVMGRYTKVQQALKDYREGRNVRNPSEALALAVQRLPTAQVGLACLLLILMIQSWFLVQTRKEVREVKRSPRGPQAGPSTVSTAPGVSGSTRARESESTRKAIPVPGVANSASSSSPRPVIPGSEPGTYQSGLVSPTFTALPPMPVQINPVRPLQTFTGPPKISSPVPPNRPGNPSPRVFTLKLVGLIEYEGEAIAILEDVQETIYKRQGDQVECRNGERWRVLAIAPDRVQLEREASETEVSTSRAVGLAGGSPGKAPAKAASKPERIALRLGK